MLGSEEEAVEVEELEGTKGQQHSDSEAEEDEADDAVQTFPNDRMRSWFLATDLVNTATG